MNLVIFQTEYMHEYAEGKKTTSSLSGNTIILRPFSFFHLLSERRAQTGLRSADELFKRLSFPNVARKRKETIFRIMKELTDL